MAKTLIPNNDAVGIMISYSRKDKEFIQKLYNELMQNSIPKENIWVDWESIPISSDWKEEIEIGVQSKDIFLFVLTPNSLSSTECGKEVEIAVANNKRIVVIVRQDPEKDSTVHPAIGATNWLFMRESDNFDNAMSGLIQTLNTDLGHVREHTRLLERTLEWEKNKRNPISVLRGKDIEDAEAWLAQGAGKEPAPTPSQIEYIQASRKTARRRQRITSIISVVVAVVLGALSIFAFFQRNNAIKNEELAIANETLAYKLEREAKARSIAALSGQQLDNDPQLALKLALYALQQTEQDGIVVPEAHSALFQSLATENISKIFDYHNSAVNELERCQGMMASGGNDGLVIVLLSYDAKPFTFNEHAGSQITGLDISPDCNLIASVDDAGRAFVWESQTGNIVQQIPTYDGIPLSNVTFNSGGNYVAVGISTVKESEYNDIIILSESYPGGYWNAYYAEQSGVNDVAFYEDNRLVSAGEDGTLVIWQPLGQTRLDTWGVGVYPVLDIEIDSSENYIATANATESIFVWSAWDGSIVHNLTDFTGDITSVNFSPDGRYLLSTGTDMRYWDMSDGNLVKVFSGHAGPILDADILYFDNLRIYSAGYDQKILEWNNIPPVESFKHYLFFTSPFNRASSGTISALSQEFNSGFAAVTNQGDLISVYTQLYSEFGSTPQEPINADFVFDGHSPSATINAIHLFPPQYVAGEPSVTISADDQGNVFVWDWTNNQILHQFSHSVGANDVIISPDERYIAIALDNGDTTIWEYASETLIHTFNTGAEKHTLALAFDPTSTYLLTGGATQDLTGFAAVWDISTGSQISQMTQFGPIRAVAYSPDGTKIVTFSDDYTGSLWDPMTGIGLVKFIGHSGAINAAAFSNDSTLLITGAGDGTMKTWDPETGLELFSFDGFAEEVISVMITTDNGFMVGIDSSGQFSVVRIGLKDLISLIGSQFLISDLTAEECRKYIGISLADQTELPCVITDYLWPFLDEYSREKMDFTKFSTPTVP